MNRDARRVVIGSPVRGEWAVMNPPGHPEAAYDFLAVDEGKSPYERGCFPRHLLSRISVTKTLAWGKPVFAPLDGVAEECSDGVPDRERIGMIYDLIRLLLFRPKPGSPFSAYGGNYVLLRSDAVYLLLAHLRCGSVRVRPGDRVKEGDLLGEVGNSGSSLQPHLHLQGMNTGQLLPLFTGLIPLALKSVDKKIGREWIPASDAPIENGDHLRLR